MKTIIIIGFFDLPIAYRKTNLARIEEGWPPREH